MATNTLIKRIDLEGLFDELDENFALYNKTEKKCPICGNDFEKIGTDTSYLIRCKTDNCIREGFRGI